MRAVREQPRLAAVRLAIAIAALTVAVLVGSALATERPEPSADLRPSLESSEQLRHTEGLTQDRAADQLKQLRADLRSATRSARARARTSQRLRGDLGAMRRTHARERQR